MSFSYYRAITFDHTQVPSDQTNIPMVVIGTISSLATVANGGRIQNSSGFDIVFSTTSDGNSPINWETVAWNATTGQVEYWLQIPTLSSSVDTVIYMCYGNSGISTDQSNGPGTWDSNYIAVYHFGTSSSLVLTNSTSNTGCTLTSLGSPTNATGILGGGAISTAVSNTAVTATFGAGAPWASGNFPVTVECWAKKGDANDGEVCGLGGNGGTGSRYANYLIATTGIAFETNGRGLKDVQALDQTTFHNYISTYDGSSNPVSLTNAEIYYDGAVGVSIINGSGNISIDNSNNSHIAVGSIPQAAGAADFTGLIDEVRFSKVVRSADWITSQYNNTKIGASTPSVGSEQSIGGLGILVADTLSLSDSEIIALGLDYLINGDAFSFSDAIIFTSGVPGIAVSDSFTFSDAQVYSENFFLPFFDTIALADSDPFSPPMNMMALGDGITLGDFLSTLVSINLVISDSFTFSDVVLVVANILLTTNDSFTFSDLFRFSVPFNRDFADNFIWRDAQTVAWSNAFPPFSDSIVLSDNVVISNAPFWTVLNESLADNFTFSDIIIYSGGINLFLSDTLGLSDSILSQNSFNPFNQVLSDSLALNDNILIIVEGELIQLADGFIFNDSVLVQNATDFNSYIRRYLNDAII